MATGAKGGGVRVEVDDADVRKGLNASVEGARTGMSEAFIDAGSLLVSTMRQNIEAHRKVDTGGLVNSIAAQITGRRGQQTLIVGPDQAHAAQAAVIEYGRRPGSKMPPQGVLLEWMGRHGIPEELEFVIRRNIGRNGLAGQPFPFAAPAYDDHRSELDALFEGVLDTVQRAWAKG